MESDKDHIKETFSSKFISFEPDLPDLIWETIDADLSKKMAVKKTPIRQKIYRIALSASAIAAMIVVVLYLFLLQEDKVRDSLNLVQSTENNTSQNVSEVDTLKLENNKIENKPFLAIYEQNRNIQARNNITNKQEELLKVSVQNVEIDDIANFDKSYAKKELDLSSLDDKEVTFISEKTKKEVQSLNIEDKSFEEDLSQRIAEFESKGKDLENILSFVDDLDRSASPKGIQLGLEGGSGFSKSNDTKSQLNSMHQGSSGVALRSGRVRLKHNQPITFGVGVTKHITKKISIETGLNYSYVSSKIRNEDDRVVKQKDAQYFHYLGIPLTISYTFSEWKRFRFYTSLGVMFQKDFYGRIRSNLYSTGIYNVNETDEMKISQKHLQFSTSATLGVSYPIYDKLRVYTNFGGAYSFDAKNEYETIYSDKKWLLNLNLGLKFEF